MTDWQNLAQIRRRLKSAHGLPSDRADVVVESALRMLERGKTEHTGLALGYVQSGKTLSFTTLMAAAADSGYGMVVGILGSTDLLFDQNRRRLLDDLGLHDRDDFRWVHLTHPDARDAEDVERYLRSGRVVLVTLLKNYRRIGRFTKLLGALGTPPERVLVVDDEADQMSLNIRVRQGEMSATYRAISDMRKALGHHVYVQYTATPFAPLLLEAEDHLAPRFVELLVPGDDYIGTSAFFSPDGVRRLTRELPETDEVNGLPGGLADAVAVYITGAALLRHQPEPAVRPPISMMVHTSHRIQEHKRLADLLTTTLAAWGQKLRRPEADPGRQSLLARLEVARRDLTSHGNVATAADEQFAKQAEAVLDGLKVWTVNSAEDVEQIDWRREPYHVLVGGNKLDRGYTVRGLTVTYMTRSLGQAQADTILQRARSFGYKRQYLDYCRFFAPARLIGAFQSLVHTEQDMRSSLLDAVDDGLSPQHWARSVGFVIGKGMRATRAGVTRRPPEILAATGWHTLRQPDRSEEAILANRGLIDRLKLDQASTQAFGKVRHRVTIVSAEAIAELLENWSLADPWPGWPRDAMAALLRKNAELGLLRELSVYLMRNDGQPRERSWIDPDGIPNLMQGSDAQTGYPGDRKLSSAAQLQVHHLKLKGGGGHILHSLAMFLPQTLVIVRAAKDVG